MSAIGTRIAEARRRAGLSQPVLAERIDYSVGLVRAVEQGKRNATAPFIDAVARELGLRVAELSEGLS